MPGCKDTALSAFRDYVEGDEVWYQPLNANSWLGPEIVLCHRGQTVFLLANGEIKKVAACKVKPYKLVERYKEDDCTCVKPKKKALLEDGLEDIKNLVTPEKRRKERSNEDS